MYNIKRSQQYSHQYLLYLLGKFIGLILMFNASACDCKPDNQENGHALKIATENQLLIGDEPAIVLNVSINDTNNKAVELEHFRLRVTIVEENNFTDEANGTTVSYITGTHGSQTFPDEGNKKKVLEKPLTEFANITELDPVNNKQFNAFFDLKPAKYVIEVKLKFELLSADNVVINELEVRWIKSEFAIWLPEEFSGTTNVFSLKSLKEDIKDLTKYTVSITSDEGVNFSFEGDSASNTATLEELLARTPILYKSQGTSPIPVEINGGGKDAAEFSISVFRSDDTDREPLTKIEGTWTERGASDLRKAKNAIEIQLKKLKSEEAELGEMPQGPKKVRTEPNRQDKKAKKPKKGRTQEPEKSKEESTIQQDDDVTSQSEQKQEFETALKANQAEQAALEAELKNIEEKIKTQDTDTSKSNTIVPKLILICSNHKLSPTDHPIYVSVRNLGGDLTEEDLKGVSLWYEIKNSTGNISKVSLQGKKVSDSIEKKEKSTRENIMIKPGKSNAVSLDKFFKHLKQHPKSLSFNIGSLDKDNFTKTVDPTIESMQVIIHLEGLEKSVPAVPVTWKKLEIPQQ